MCVRGRVVKIMEAAFALFSPGFILFYKGSWLVLLGVSRGLAAMARTYRDTRKLCRPIDTITEREIVCRHSS